MQQTPPANAPVWQLQSSGSTAGLRGIDSVDGANGTVAWASGSGGTVLRTTDGGQNWTRCATPDAKKDGATLDFRGVQAWDASTAIVMASGPGAKSRLYKTADGCKTWRLLFTNPDAPNGFWDALKFIDWSRGFILGDPVAGYFVLFFTVNGGKHWGRLNTSDLAAPNVKAGAFAASNSALIVDDSGQPTFGTSGPGGPWLYIPRSRYQCTMLTAQEYPALCLSESLGFRKVKMPMDGDSSSAGVFSLAIGPIPTSDSPFSSGFVAVGGDYRKPDATAGTAVAIVLGQLNPTAAEKPPHGFRSAVQWSAALKAWITVGTNGSDISRDDGRTWRPLDNGNWNALSLPFVVGPDGRIAKLNPSAIPKP
ncbi:MAG: hypothetical protein WBD67_00590 [Terracidiphilus sp.]